MPESPVHDPIENPRVITSRVPSHPQRTTSIWFSDNPRAQRPQNVSCLFLVHIPVMSSALARYESFLLNNVSVISSLESSLRSVTWFLPGRFKDAELASEACAYCNPNRWNNASFVPVAALLSTTSLYHDTLLNRVMQSDPKYKSLIPSSPHSRYTRAWTKKNPRYKWFARTLEVLRYLELLIEMGLRRKASDRTRWRVITLIECLKYVFSFRL